MIRPRYLEKGDNVGLISTARKVNEMEITKGVEVIRSWGLNVIEGENLYASDRQFAGTDDERAADLQKMLYDPSIKAIFCARGGYGTVRIVDKLDFRSFNAEPKWICGFSDITVLHAHLQQCLNCQSLHMPMPLTFPLADGATLDLCKDILFGKELAINIPTDNRNKRGTAKGILVGGNLSVLFSLLGSHSFPNTAGKILFIEDLDEYLYHIDRMIVALDRAGHLAELNGLMIGAMTDMNDNEAPYGKDAIEIILDTVSKYDYPIVCNVPSGHINNNKPLIMGSEVKMEIANETLISFL